MKTSTLTQSEIRVLQSLHLQGHMGKCGSMNKQQRLNLLLGLQEKGLIDDRCQLTQLGIHASSPSQTL